MAKFIIKKAKSEFNQWYFTLKANNNEIILTSELYSSKQGAEKGIQAIKSAVLEIVDKENEDIINNAKFPNGV